MIAFRSPEMANYASYSRGFPLLSVDHHGQPLRRSRPLPHHFEFVDHNPEAGEPLHHRVQTGSGAHSASYPMDTGDVFPGGKAAGA
jgi:hypothetical protein